MHPLASWHHKDPHSHTHIRTPTHINTETHGACPTASFRRGVHHHWRWPRGASCSHPTSERAKCCQGMSVCMYTKDNTHTPTDKGETTKRERREGRCGCCSRRARSSFILWHMASPPLHSLPCQECMRVCHHHQLPANPPLCLASLLSSPYVHPPTPDTHSNSHTHTHTHS